MRILIINCLIIICSLTTKGQSYLEHFKEGIELHNKGFYKKADSLYTIAINEKGDDAYDIYFNRGIARLMFNDTIGHCSDMKYLISVNDEEAISYYKINCIKDNPFAFDTYKKGLDLDNSSEPLLADSLLTLSVNEYPFVENVFARGINRLKLKDTLGFYIDMSNIYQYDERAKSNVLCFYNAISRIKKPTLPENISFNYSSSPINKDNRTIDIINNTDTAYFAEEDYKHFDEAKDAFNIFILNNLRYPEEAALLNKSGRVFVEFIIDLEGSIKYIKVPQNTDPFLKNEVYRVVSEMPPFEPGKLKRKPCLMKFIFPINFILQ